MASYRKPERSSFHIPAESQDARFSAGEGKSALSAVEKYRLLRETRRVLRRERRAAERKVDLR
ncbi:hypothetical protein GCM10007872_03210 [Gluconobacter sphaericus NBRC 12467]|uniref:Uncharacterized protein n=1 Tax=Gluconobacter sphaericus NBRC 12467 TaxID=1307951 RepID=A0AA37SFS5_9PROT|nr:hypothetical protein GCM10007872_03210 [Gluconobacter sphaericus NBRC 12467]